MVYALPAFVATFPGASLLNIAAGQPFTPVQILWISFLIDTPLAFSFAFGASYRRRTGRRTNVA